MYRHKSRLETLERIVLGHPLTERLATQAVVERGNLVDAESLGCLAQKRGGRGMWLVIQESTAPSYPCCHQVVELEVQPGRH